MRPAFHRHIGMGHGPLQRQDRRQLVHVHGETGGLLVGHEPQVVVPVNGLGGPARVDQVDLRCDLVARAEPGDRHPGQNVVGEVLDEYVRVTDGQLAQRIPKTGVRPRLGEVVAAALPAGDLLVDQGRKDGCGPVDHRRVEGALDEDHARPFEQSAR